MAYLDAMQHMQELIESVLDHIRGDKLATEKQLRYLAGLSCTEGQEIPDRFSVCAYHELTTKQAHYLIEGLILERRGF